MASRDLNSSDEFISMHWPLAYSRVQRERTRSPDPSYALVSLTAAGDAAGG